MSVLVVFFLTERSETETEHVSVDFPVKPAKKSAFQMIQCACVGIKLQYRVVSSGRPAVPAAAVPEGTGEHI